MDQPTNFLSYGGFSFKLSNCPNLNFCVQKVSVPGMRFQGGETNSPFLGSPLKWVGKIFYDSLKITFKVDEDLKNYMEIFRWMEHLGHPDNLDPQYENIRVDGNLSILNNQMNPVMSVTFTDMFPQSVSELDFDSTLTDQRYVDATVEFGFNRFYYNEI